MFSESENFSDFCSLPFLLLNVLISFAVKVKVEIYEIYCQQNVNQFISVGAVVKIPDFYALKLMDKA